jgi:hypothetical protein
MQEKPKRPYVKKKKQDKPPFVPLSTQMKNELQKERERMQELNKLLTDCEGSATEEIARQRNITTIRINTLMAKITNKKRALPILGVQDTPYRPIQ